MKAVAKSARLFHQHYPMLVPTQFGRQLKHCATTAFAAVHRPPTSHSHRQHPAMELDIERHVNHIRFGPKPFKDCRKMSNDIIFQSVGNHDPSRMAPPGAVLEAYMSLTSVNMNTRQAAP